MSEPDEAEEPPADVEDRPSRHIDWRKVKLSGGTALTFVGMVAGGAVCLRMVRWAACDGTWLCSPRTKTTTVISAAPTTVVPATRAPSTAAEAPSAPVITEEPAAPVPSSRQLGPYSAAAAITTVPSSPAAKAGMGDLWMNVCGNSSSGYRMCRGSKPTDAQRAADFPPGAKDL